MPQKLTINNIMRPLTSGAVHFFDANGQLDWPGLYVQREDAAAIASAIEAVDDYLKSNGTDPVLYAVYFGRLLSLRDLIRRDVLID